MADSAVTPDKVDRYEIISILGEGGTGIVYKAFDPILQKIVAIKVLEAEIDQANVQHVRFQREARALRDLHHDAVPLVYDFAITSDGAPYMVMEYIEGTPLSMIISARKGLTIDEFLDFGLQICAVLIYAHRHGIVHRDIKPSNIILVKEGEGFAAHLVDFGLVKLEAPDLSEDDEKIKNIGVSTDELTSGVQ